MKKINLFSRLWSSGGNSQSSDVGYDSRLTVGSPSGLESSTVLKFVSVLVLILTIGSGNAWGAEGDVLAQCQGTGSGYGTRRTTTDSYSVGWVLATGQSGYLGVNNATNHGKVKPTANDLPVVQAVLASASTSTTGYYFYYTSTAISNVGSIEFTHTATNNASPTTTAYVVCSSTAASSGSATWTQVTLDSSSPCSQGASVKNASGGTYTFTFDETQTSALYYGIVIKTTAYQRFTSGTIKIKEGASSSCDNSVTIQAANSGTGTNCTFTLSPNGAQESCDGVATTVSITPTTGYGNPVVTQSGASAAPTISGSGNSWTVTYAANTTGTSTINVSCSAKTTTVSFNQNGGTGGQTTTKTATYGSAMPTPITTPTREHYTFEGYYDGSGGTGTKYYKANGTSAKNWDKENSTYTLYAKWTTDKYTVTWSVNGTTYQTTSNVPYNTTTAAPADPTPSGDCAGLVFRGWTATANYEHATNPPGNMFNTTTPPITGDITFHAVFAEEDD